jgi:hypothetical protein
LSDQQYVCETLVSLVISTTMRFSFTTWARVCNLPQHEKLSGDDTDARHMVREGRHPKPFTEATPNPCSVMAI